MAFKHAVEDEIVQRDRGLQRIADDIVEIEAGKPPCLGEAVGMDEHDRAEFLGLLPERRKGRIGEFLAGHVSQYLHALELERRHAARELARGLVAVGHRDGAQRSETIGLCRHIGRNTVIDHPGGLDGDVRWHRVVALRRRAHDELQVDAHGVEIGKTLVMAGHQPAAVAVLARIERLGLRRCEIDERNGSRVEMRLYELCRLRDCDMGMDVDGHALRPRGTPLFGALWTRGGRSVTIPVLGHAESFLCR